MSVTNPLGFNLYLRQLRNSRGWSLRDVEKLTGSTEWHPEPQWLMRAVDLDKGGGAVRDFALKDMIPLDSKENA